MPHRFIFIGSSLALLLAFVVPAPAEAGRCENHQPERQVFFGDLHIHTAISMDANLFGTRIGPDEAYRFGRGETVHLTPAQGDRPAARPVVLDRPLDFAAVTDHASNFGGVRLCTTPGSPSYDSDACTAYRKPFDPAGRDGIELRTVITELMGRLGVAFASAEVCGEKGEHCLAAGIEVWEDTKRAAERWNDDSAECRFTTFVAYEYTATPELTKIHRNVIFRNDRVLPAPISYADEPDAIQLWKRLRAECIDAGTGCDVLAIPHNPNLSNGNMFALEYGDAKTDAEQAEIARLRAQIEPVVEMMQMKGDSECRNGLWKVLGGTDELCDFEKMRPANVPDCKGGTGLGALGGEGCVSRLDYARYALVEGMREAERIGVNPYPFGMIAATDGHDGVAGPTEEHRLDLGIGRPNPQPGMNLGGLAAVWAEENDRDALFAAMRRREVYGTSGPRMKLRFFGGFDIPEGICDAPELAKQGYAKGVPMGGEFGRGSDGASPRFVISALRDTGTAKHPGGLLERIQIIKGWAGDDGAIHQQVVDVAGSPGTATVDTDSCAPSGPGAEALCGVWSDPEFDPAQRAVYYARVVENPSCNTAGWACKVNPETPFCKMPGLGKTTQERAWSSPIWYTP